MRRARVIPVLSLRGKGLVKTIKFKNPSYVGDPLNVVRIFNEKEVDELVVLDIFASKENRGPNFNILKVLAEECFMPLAYGGGLSELDDVKRIFDLGYEKVVFNSVLFDNINLITETARIFGSQAVVASIDYDQSVFGKLQVKSHSKRKVPSTTILNFARMCQEAGAGEILLNCIYKDGTREGYDLDTIDSVAENITLPVIACGGAGSIEDIENLLKTTSASAGAAGSFFVHQGKHRAVLVSYPSSNVIQGLAH